MHCSTFCIPHYLFRIFNITLMLFFFFCALMELHMKDEKMADMVQRVWLKLNEGSDTEAESNKIQSLPLNVTQLLML